MGETRNSTYTLYDSSMSYVFRDFEYGQVVSTRYYDDVFPNELSELYNLDNNLVPAVNDNNDEDSTNDITTSVPALDNLLSLSHPEDDVPALFDRRIIVNDSVEFTNILATTEVVSIPATYNEGTGINDYLGEQQIAANVIEVIPEEGVYYDNLIGYSPNNLQGYRYLYYDDDGDGLHNIIFIADTDGEVLGIGIDYDGNSHFEPHKVMLVEKHIIASEVSEDNRAITLEAAQKYDYRINFEDDDDYDGFFVEPAFRDSLFDIWKTQYTLGSSELIKLARRITARQFMASLTPEKITGDLTFQISAQLISFTIGQIVSGYVTGACIAAGGSIGSAGGPIGAAVGLLVGMLIYFSLNSIWAIAQQEEVNNLLASQATYNEEYESTKTLSDKWWEDRYFGDMMSDALQGSKAGVYTPIRAETDKHIFEGEVVLAPAHLEKTTNFGAQFNRILLDYSQQSRSYLAYSDFDNSWVHSFFYQEVEDPDNQDYDEDDTIIVPRDKRVMYMRNSIMYLEDEIYRITEEDTEDTTSYDSIIPIMVGIRPSLQVVDSNSYAVPEFYLDHPIYVDHEKYEDLQEEFYHIYKIYNSTSNSIQLIPEEYIGKRTLMSDVVKAVPYYVDSLGNEEILPFEIGLTTKEETIYEGLPQEDFVPQFTFNPITGEVTLDSDSKVAFDRYLSLKKSEYQNVQGYEGRIILEFCIEKYRDITVEREDITSEEAQQIATMQSAHQSILEYIYQFTLAEQTEQKLSEATYTAFITIISTIVVIGATWGMNALAGGNIASKVADKVVGSRLSTDQLINYLVDSFNSLGPSIYSTQACRVFSALMSPIIETFEEIYVDPFIEGLVSGAAEDAGLDATAQILLSGLAESGRETFLSSVSSFARAFRSLSIDTQSYTNLNNPAIQSQEQLELVLEAQGVQEQQEANRQARGQFIIEASSTILMFAGAMTGGILGGIGSAMGSSMIAIGTVVQGIDEMKDIFETVLQARHIKAQKADADIAYSSLQMQLAIMELEALTFERPEISTLSTPRRPVATHEMVEDIAQAYPYGFYGSVDPRLGALYFYYDLGYDVNEIMVYSGGMSTNPMSRRPYSGSKYGDDTVLSLFLRPNLLKYAPKNILNLITFKALRAFARKVSNKIQKDLKWNPKIKSLSNFYLTKKDLQTIDVIKCLSQILTTEGKIKYQWWGYTYRFVDKRTGFYQAGYATEPNLRRLTYYIRNIFNPGLYTFESGERQIYGLIYDYLKSLGIKQFILETKGDGTIITNRKKIKKAIEGVFDFEITGVFWGENQMKQAEEDQIKVGTLRTVVRINNKYEVQDPLLIGLKKASKFTTEVFGIIDKYNIPYKFVGTSLNKPKAAKKGNISPNTYIPYVAAYISLGYSRPKIQRLLKTQNKIDLDVDQFVRDQFGSWINARSLFITPMFNILDSASIRYDDVVKLYKEYFTTATVKPFYSEVLIDLLLRGFTLNEAVKTDPSLWHMLDYGSAVKGSSNYAGFRKQIEKFMIESFPLLRPAQPKILRDYVLFKAFIKLSFDRLSLFQISTKFRSHLSSTGHISTRVVRRVLSSFSGFKTFDDLILAHDIDMLRFVFLTKPEHLIHTSTQVANVLKISEKVLLERCQLFIDRSKLENVRQKLDILQHAQVAVIGPELIRAYQLGFSENEIVQKIGFFTHSDQVVEWTFRLFRESPQNVRMFLRMNPDWWGVRFWQNKWAINPDFLIIDHS